DVDAVEVVRLRAVVLRQRDLVLVLDETTKPDRRLDGRKSVHRIAAAVGQPRILRCDEAEDVEVAGSQRQVVDDLEVAVPAAEVAHVERDARKNLVLDTGRELPVVPALVPARARALVPGE